MYIGEFRFLLTFFYCLKKGKKLADIERFAQTSISKGEQVPGFVILGPVKHRRIGIEDLLHGFTAGNDDFT